MTSMESNSSSNDYNQQQTQPILLPPLPPLEQLPDLRAAKEHLIDALKLMPENKVVAYKTALQQNPGLVAIESNLYKFFQRSGYNGLETAARLCEYWTVRRELFGEERWLKPILDLTPGVGALSELSKKFIYFEAQKIMPYDGFGRACVLADRLQHPSRMKKKLGIDPKHKHEYIFYQLQQLSDLPGIGTEGFSFYYVLHETEPEVYPAVHRFFSKVLRDCFPIRLNLMHIVFAPIKEKQCSQAQKFTSYLFECLKLPFSFTRLKVEYIKPDKNSTNLTFYQTTLADFLVQKCNMKPEFLPAIAGGSWNVESFQQWKKLRIDGYKNTLTVAHPLFQQLNNEVNMDNSAVALSPLELLAYTALKIAPPQINSIKRDAPNLAAVNAKKPRNDR